MEGSSSCRNLFYTMPSLCASIYSQLQFFCFPTDLMDLELFQQTDYAPQPSSNNRPIDDLDLISTNRTNRTEKLPTPFITRRKKREKNEIRGKRWNKFLKHKKCRPIFVSVSTTEWLTNWLPSLKPDKKVKPLLKPLGEEWAVSHFCFIKHTDRLASALSGW